VHPHAAMFLAAPNPTSQPRWAPSCHVSSSSKTRLPAKVGSDIATCTMAPDPWGGLWGAMCPAFLDPAPLQGELRTATHPAALCGPRATHIKERGMHPRAATFPTTRDPASQLMWAPELPYVQQLQDPTSSQCGLRHCHVYHGSGPAGRVPGRRMFYGSGSCPL
jgi:hypothetical protein